MLPKRKQMASNLQICINYIVWRICYYMIWWFSWLIHYVFVYFLPRTYQALIKDHLVLISKVKMNWNISGGCWLPWPAAQKGKRYQLAWLQPGKMILIAFHQWFCIIYSYDDKVSEWGRIFCHNIRLQNVVLIGH